MPDETGNINAVRAFLECKAKHDRQGDLSSGEGRGKQPFVTLSRQTGAGGQSIARELISYLNQHDTKNPCGWHLFDKDLVQVVLEDHHLPAELEKFMSESKASEIRDVIETMLKMHPPRFALFRQTCETILRLAHMGSTVIVGRGGHLMTRRLKYGLHVRLVGSFEKRRSHIEEYYKYSREEAERFVREQDKARAAYVQQNFGKDPENPALYDMVINTDYLVFDTVAGIIGDAVLEKIR